MKRSQWILCLILALLITVPWGGAYASEAADSEPVFQYNWVEEDGSWYCYDTNDVLLTGWIQDGGSWYYADENGVIQIGWLQVDGDRYLTDEDGALYIDTTVTLDGRVYTFDGDGVCIEESAPLPTAEELFDETYWDVSFGCTDDTTFWGQFHLDGTFTLINIDSTAFSGTYDYEDGRLTLYLDESGDGIEFAYETGREDIYLPDTEETLPGTGGDGFYSTDAYFSLGTSSAYTFHMHLSPDGSAFDELQGGAAADPQPADASGATFLGDKLTGAGKADAPADEAPADDAPEENGLHDKLTGTGKAEP